MADEGGAENFDISRVITRAFGAIGANMAIFLGLALIFSGIPSFVASLWQLEEADLASDPAMLWTVGYWAPFSIAILVGIVANAVLQAALTRATVTYLSDDEPDFGKSLVVGLSMILPMIAISILLAIGLLFGFLLLIVPGILLWLAWSVVVPAYVQERIGIFEAFGRSAALTSGARSKIFLLFLAVVIGASLLTFPIGLLSGATGAEQGPLTYMVTAIWTAVSGMVTVTLQASVYVELRDIKEGVAPGELEAIFA